MSHFSVLVAANNEDDLRVKLQPYHEYECTGIMDEYVQFVECDLESCQKEYADKGADYTSFEEYMEDYHGYELNEDGKWGRWTNPNDKWDWWVVGGRWSGLLKSKNGKDVDTELMSNIDWDGMEQEKIRSEMSRYEDFHKAKALPEKEVQEHLWKSGLLLLSKREAEILDSSTMAEYLEKIGREALTFAWIDLEGKWHQKAEMGWWGSTSDHNDNAGNEFWAFIESLPGDQRVYVVDCHI